MTNQKGEYVVIRSDGVMLLTTDPLDAFNALHDLKEDEEPCYMLVSEGGRTYAYC